MLYYPSLLLTHCGGEVELAVDELNLAVLGEELYELVKGEGFGCTGVEAGFCTELPGDGGFEGGAGPLAVVLCNELHDGVAVVGGGGFCLGHGGVVVV